MLLVSLTFYFEIIVKLHDRKVSCILHPVSPKGYILHSYSTISEPKTKLGTPQVCRVHCCLSNFVDSSNQDAELPYRHKDFLLLPVIVRPIPHTTPSCPWPSLICSPSVWLCYFKNAIWFKSYNVWLFECIYFWSFLFNIVSLISVCFFV